MVFFPQPFHFPDRFLLYRFTLFRLTRTRSTILNLGSEFPHFLSYYLDYHTALIAAECLFFPGFRVCNLPDGAESFS